MLLCLQCFQSSWLTITSGPPLAQICQAASVSQVKPSRRRGCQNPLEPHLPPLHTHTHKQQTPTSPLLPSQPHSRDSRYFTLSTKGLLGSHHILVWRLASCHQQSWWGGGHILAQYGSAQLSTVPLSAHTSHWSSLFMTFSLWLLIHQNCIIFQTQSRHCHICGVSGAQQVL